MILRNGLRDPSGRRFSNEEQILCLSIYKTSAKAYRYLRTFLPLPSITTLKKVLRKVSMDTGVTKETRSRLKIAGQSADSEKRKAVVVMWDELLLGLGLHYDESKDKIVVFEDWGNVRTNKFADHGLVFMMRFVNSGDILPISFNFCEGHTTKGQLSFCIKDVIGAVKDASLNVVATICDGGSSNQSVIDTFMQDTDRLKGHNYILTNGCFILFDMEIIPLFDPPHLIKCLRNNLLDKDLEFDVDPKKKSSNRSFASWQHIIDVYEIDVYGLQNQKFLPKLTDRHIYPNKIKEMRVKNAIQIFSLSVASRLEDLAGAEKEIHLWDPGKYQKKVKILRGFVLFSISWLMPLIERCKQTNIVHLELC